MLASVANGADDPLRSADLSKLCDPARREAEVARLTERDPKSPPPGQVRFLTAGQKDGAPPLHVLCVASGFEFPSISTWDGAYKLEKPEELFDIATRSIPFRTEPDLDPVRESELIVFDDKGRELRPFGGNNYTNEGYYADFDHDGILDRADSTHYSVAEAPEDSVQVFKLQSIEPEPRTLLEVIFNWHPSSAGKENEWDFTCFDDDKDGTVEIAFGPASAVQPEAQRKFVFRWDPSKKCYSPGEIHGHSHIRVVKTGETLASIAQSGALGYPVIEDSSDPDEKAPPPSVSSRPPYQFHSFKDRPDAELAAFFQGKIHRDSFNGPEDSFANRLPANLWDLTPKQAALAIAEANRTPTHRERWKLAIDDRNGVAPPASGWMVDDWGSSSCYSFSSHLFALRFGVPGPGLTVFEYNSIGVVGRNPWADQPGRNVRLIQLTEAEARFIADTVFWLDHVRSYSPRKPESNGFSSSTADGSATLSVYPDHGAPRELANGTVWATSSISGSWNADYNPTVFINLAEHFIADGIPARLGDRWSVAPEVGHHNLATPTEERLAPRVDADARQQLTESYAAIFDRHAKDPIPAAVLESIVRAAGDEALTGLLPGLRELLDSLPPENAEDREFAALEKRFERGHFGNPLEEEETADSKHARNRLTELREKREFLPAAILRNPLSEAIAKLHLAENPSALMDAAAADTPDSPWALRLLHRLDPEGWSALMASQFRKADVESRRTLIETLAAGNPAGAARLIENLTPDENRDLIIETAGFHLRQDRPALAKDLPVLMSLLRDRQQDYIRRGEAMGLIAEAELTATLREEFTGLLEQEIRSPQQGQYGMSSLDSAIRALTRVAGTADHLNLITTTPGIASQAFDAGFGAILKMTEGQPDRRDILAGFLRHRLTEGPGMMNDIFLHALGFDLHSLAPDIAGFASENPVGTDGDGAEYSGGKFKTPVGQRYHIAREITALWSETDPATLGRMWVFFVAAHPYQFMPGQQGDPMNRELTELATKSILALTSEARRETIQSALNLIPISAYAATTESWLRDLGKKP